MKTISQETIDARSADLASYQYTLKELAARWGVTTRCVSSWKSRVGGGYARVKKKRGPKPRDIVFGEIASLRMSGAKPPEIAAQLGISCCRVKKVFSAIYLAEKKSRDASWRIDAEKADKTPCELAALWKCNVKTATLWLDRNGYKSKTWYLSPNEYAQRMADYKRIGRRWTELGRLWNINAAPARTWVINHHPEEVFPKFKKLTTDELNYAVACLVAGESARSVAVRNGWLYRSVLNALRGTIMDIRDTKTDQRLADARSGMYTIQELAARWGVTQSAASIWVSRRLGIKVRPSRDVAAERKARIASGASNAELAEEWKILPASVNYWRQRKVGGRPITPARIDKMRRDTLRFIDATVLSARDCAEKWLCTQQNARDWISIHKLPCRGYSASLGDREAAHQFGRAVDALYNGAAGVRAIIDDLVSIDPPLRTIWVGRKRMVGLSWESGGIAIVDGGRLLTLVKDGGEAALEERTRELFLSVGGGEICFSTDGVVGSLYPNTLGWEIIDEK